MGRDQGELEMRIAGFPEGRGEGAVQAALARLDPAVRVRLDAATGITHILTSCDTIEIEDALTRAGFDVTAATG